MKTLVEEYGDALVAVVIAAAIFATLYLVLPFVQDLIPSFLNTLIGE